MLELEALGLDRVRTGVSVQYVDHNLLQADSKNADDHLFLRSLPPLPVVLEARQWRLAPRAHAAVRRPRSGPDRLGQPHLRGRVAGHAGHGAGGLDVAMAMAGEPLYLRMPEIWGVELRGQPPAWVSAKDVVLEMLRRHGVKGAVNRIIEYHGDGLAHLTAMDRHVIANMGAELGATTSVFPADEAVRAFLRTSSASRTTPGCAPSRAPPTTAPRPSTCPRWNR